jgi:hypothetical protein
MFNRLSDEHVHLPHLNTSIYNEICRDEVADHVHWP